MSMQTYFEMVNNMVLQWRVLVWYISFTVIQNINDTYFVSKIGWNDDNKDTKGLNGACRKDQWLIVRLPGKGDDIMDRVEHSCLTTWHQGQLKTGCYSLGVEIRIYSNARSVTFVNIRGTHAEVESSNWCVSHIYWTPLLFCCCGFFGGVFGFVCFFLLRGVYHASEKLCCICMSRGTIA